MKLIRKSATAVEQLKPFKIPEGFVFIQDTREQKPLFKRPIKDLMVIGATLKNGDYSIKGFEDTFAIERKQISDLYSYIGKERKRTVEKMKRFLRYKFVGLVIEASETEILSGHIFSKLTPEMVRQALVSFEIRYGVHIYYSKSRHDIARWVLDRAIKFYRVMREV